MRRLRCKNILREGEQGDDFAHRAFPIVGGKCVEREGADAQAGSGAHDTADGFDSSAMAFGAGEAARRSPAAVAVEEDGDVEFAIGGLTSKYFCS